MTVLAFLKQIGMFIGIIHSVITMELVLAKARILLECNKASGTDAKKDDPPIIHRPDLQFKINGV